MIPTIRNRRVRQPMLEGLEARVVMSTFPAKLFSPHRLAPPGYIFLIPIHRPVAPPNASSSITSFIDPTATISAGSHVAIAGQAFIGPFATLVTGKKQILIGQGSNLQLNSTVDARQGNVTISDNTAIGPGVTIVGPSKIGGPGGGPGAQPVFIGSNAVINGATLEPFTYVSANAKVGPGIVIHRGKKVLPGVDIETQQEADNVALKKVTAISSADLAAVTSVLRAFTDLASSTSAKAQAQPNGP